MLRLLLASAVIALAFVPSGAAVLEVPVLMPEAGEEVIDDVKQLVIPEEEAGQEQPAPPEEEKPGFADRVRSAFGTHLAVFSFGSLALAAASAGGFALVTRYISPKEALKNPQRAMLYGFVRATPGAHLKQLSEEFKMKTSSILWHIRKLESAELVKSERVNGYRVFYPVEGGVEIKRVSRAMAALQNDNAHRVFGHIQRNPGATARTLSERLSLHGGTVRWHLRKLRDHGLLDELIQEDASRFFPTPLGNRALEAREGRPVDLPRGTAIPTPSD